MSDIIIKNLCKSYGDNVVLHDFCAVIPEGDVCCLMSPSGSGKTTLMRIIMGLENADSGTIIGLENKKISAVFQENRLCHWLDAVNNIRLVCPDCTSERAKQALKNVNLDIIDGQPVSTLSGGMQRRVAIIRACLAPFDLLILDEPFQGLDAATKKIVSEQMKIYFEGKTVIFITHNIDELELFPIKSKIELN